MAAPEAVNEQLPTVDRYLYEGRKYQPMQTDPCDALDHAQSPIAMYTKLDAECDQQVTFRRATVDATLQLLLSSPSVINKQTYRPTIVACLSHSATVEVPWPNLLSLDFGIKFHREDPLFFEIS